MTNNARVSTTTGTGPAPEKTYFESQREILVGEIAQSLEHVLQNVNKLNRSLEEVIAVGNEFSPVEALWSQFESVMAKDASEKEAMDENKEDERETEVGGGGDDDVDG